MKKITSLLMILALLASSVLLVACSPESTDTTTESTTTSTDKNNASDNDENTTTTKQEDNNNSPAENPTYTITVIDQDGNPVEGVMVQFCAGSSCQNMFGNFSNAEGKIVITSMPANPEYEVSATVAPSTFDMSIGSENTKKYTFDANNCLTITLVATDSAE